MPLMVISGASPFLALCFLFTMRWRSLSAISSHYHYVLPKCMGPSNHELNPLKPWAKINPSSFKLLSQIFWSQLCKTNTLAFPHLRVACSMGKSWTALEENAGRCKCCHVAERHLYRWLGDCGWYSATSKRLFAKMPGVLALHELLAPDITEIIPNFAWRKGPTVQN
jgi:hypothetical protein